MSQLEQISKAFNKIAIQYEKASKLQNEVGKRLFERLNYLKINPRFVLDLGCGTGTFLTPLRARYPKATVIGLDLSEAMAHLAKNKKRRFKSPQLILGDMHQLPFQNGIFDLVFSNQTLNYSTDTSKLLREINRVMAQDGCLMFSTLGPDTGIEIERAWVKIDKHPHRNHYLDMHDLGDMLIHEHYLDPVMDMEYITLQANSISQLLHTVKSQGSLLLHPEKYKGLTSLKKWEQFTQQYDLTKTSEGKLQLTHEIIYGQAWKGNKTRQEKGHESYFAIEQLRKKT